MRFTSTDSLGNVHYLVVTKEQIYLTNPQQVPLALSNICDDAAMVTFMLEDIMSTSFSQAKADWELLAQDILNVLHMKTRGKWSVL